MSNRILLAATAVLALAGCVSLAPDPPAKLLTLTPAAFAPSGEGSGGTASSALVVAEPGTTARLAVTRVPVQVSDSSLAYLKDAQWVEKPTRLFRNLLAETIHARSKRLVVAEGALGYATASTLSGQLLDMGYDAASGSVIIRYDAMLQLPGGEVRTRRFESRVDGVQAKAEPVGAALNQAANSMAGEVADWVG
jgi:cholesterol transport system auxiliary component